MSFILLWNLVTGAAWETTSPDRLVVPHCDVGNGIHLEMAAIFDIQMQGLNNFEFKHAIVFLLTETICINRSCLYDKY